MNNNIEVNNQRQPREFKNLTANQQIYRELSDYEEVVGFGNFSKVLRTKNPEETLELLLTPTSEGGYSFLTEVSENYWQFIAGADETDSKLLQQNADIFYKMTDAFEGFISTLYFRGLL